MRRLMGAIVFGAALLGSQGASAGIYSDEMGKCLVGATSSEDQIALMQWLFAAMAVHPDVQPLSKIDAAQREAIGAKAGALVERLLTQTCRAQTVAALKYEGPLALQTSFSLLGQVAMRSLMSNPAVANSIGAGLMGHVDQSKLDDVLKEAGIDPQAMASPPPPH